VGKAKHRVHTTVEDPHLNNSTPNLSSNNTNNSNTTNSNNNSNIKPRSNINPANRPTTNLKTDDFLRFNPKNKA
jgi:hypothetical protein